MDRLHERRATRLIARLGAAAVVGLATVGLVPTVLHSDAALADLTGGQPAVANRSTLQLAPGDVVHHLLRREQPWQPGADGVTFSLTAKGHESLVGVGTRAIVVTVDGCSVAWDPVTATCPGAQVPLLAPTRMGELAEGRPLRPPLGSGPVPRLQDLRLTLRVPDFAEHSVNGVLPADTVQGAPVRLQWALDAGPD